MSFKDGAMENIGKLTFFSLIFIWPAAMQCQQTAE